MKKNEIIEVLKPKCNGYDLPLSLNIDLIAELLVNKQLEAINYTRCSTQLKDEKVPTFDEWLSHFEKTEDDCYWLNKEVLYCKEAMKLHYDNLPDE